MAQRENGSWILVVRQREQGGAQGKEDKHGLFTVFVDNLPSAMDAKTLFKLFTQFGIVKDAFIPFKRRTVSNSRFGFVRFDCLVVADIAIQKANGLLIGLRSFAEVLKGNTPTVVGKASLTIKANEEGHGWLYDSAIVKLNTECSIITIENVLKEKGLDQEMVRNGGGQDIVLTFQSQKELKSNICNIKEWFKDWSQFVVEWKPGFYLEQERCVWLRCNGIPLNL
ncbi:hypothetical protein ACSBR2_016608 [Camellia fascicularis]